MLTLARADHHERSPKPCIVSSSISLPRSARFAPYSAPARPQLLRGQAAARSLTSQASSSDACAYLVGLYSPASASLTFIPADVCSIHPAPSTSPPSANAAQLSAASDRARLGLAFGTRKAARAIRTAERNTVNPNSAHLQTLQPFLQTAIATTAADLPETIQNADHHYLKPQINSSLLENVYPLSSIVPLAVLESLDTSKLLTVENIHEALNMLPYRHSSLLKRQANTILRPYYNKSSHDSKRSPMASALQSELRSLVYLALLLSIRHAGKSKHSQIPACLGDWAQSRPIVQHISESFVTEIRSQQERKTVVIDYKLDELLRTICVLYLRASDYRIDLSEFAADTAVTSQKAVDIAKSLGCRIESSVVQSTKNSAEQIKVKFAQLKLPIVIPEQRQRRK